MSHECHIDVDIMVRMLILMCVKNTAPEPEPGIQSELAVQTAVQLWSCAMTGTVNQSLQQQTNFTVEMMNIASFG